MFGSDVTDAQIRQEQEQAQQQLSFSSLAANYPGHDAYPFGR
jgi:hypothetical protein